MDFFLLFFKINSGLFKQKEFNCDSFQKQQQQQKYREFFYVYKMYFIYIYLLIIKMCKIFILIYIIKKNNKKCYLNKNLRALILENINFIIHFHQIFVNAFLGLDICINRLR